MWGINHTDKWPLYPAAQVFLSPSLGPFPAKLNGCMSGLSVEIKDSIFSKIFVSEYLFETWH